MVTRRGIVSAVSAATLGLAGCASAPGPGNTASCMQQGIVFMPFLLPLLPAICAPEIVHSEIAQRREQYREDRGAYLAGFESIGVLPETEISPAGELYLNKYSLELNDRGRVDAQLVVGLYSRSSAKEYSIEIDVEADCAAETLHARNARSYDDIGGLGDLVAYRPMPTEPIEGVHPVLRTSLERMCESTALERKAAALNQSPPPSKGSEPGLFDPL